MPDGTAVFSDNCTKETGILPRRRRDSRRVTSRNDELLSVIQSSIPTTCGADVFSMIEYVRTSWSQGRGIAALVVRNGNQGGCDATIFPLNHGV
jgi:hypothetical protein